MTYRTEGRAPADVDWLDGRVGTMPETDQGFGRTGPVRATEVTVEINGRRLLDEVDLLAPAGRLTGILGPNGAGKSTLLRALSGVATPTAGQVEVAGRPVATLSRRDRARTIALVEQEAGTELPLTVTDVVMLGRTPHRQAWAAASVHDQEMVADALAAVGLSALAHQSWRTLSGGERQRTQLARALAQQPSALLLDEPTNHLDVQAQLGVLALVRRLGVTAVASLHDLNLAAAHCDHLVLLSRGRVVASGAPAEVLVPDTVQDVYGVRPRIVETGASGRPVLVFDPSP
ncbi:MAG: ABC transporter ATP-binding protein [Propionibacteriaceae bacterium]